MIAVTFHYNNIRNLYRSVKSYSDHVSEIMVIDWSGNFKYKKGAKWKVIDVKSETGPLPFIRNWIYNIGASHVRSGSKILFIDSNSIIKKEFFEKVSKGEIKEWRHPLLTLCSGNDASNIFDNRIIYDSLTACPHTSQKSLKKIARLYCLEFDEVAIRFYNEAILKKGPKIKAISNNVHINVNAFFKHDSFNSLDICSVKPIMKSSFSIYAINYIRKCLGYKYPADLEIEYVASLLYIDRLIDSNRINDRINGNYTLIVSLYDEMNCARAIELIMVLVRNLMNPYVGSVHVLYEGSFKDGIVARYLRHLKNHITIQKINNRPTFKDFVDYCDFDGIAIMANSDILLTDTIRFIDRIDMENRFICLTRWEIYNGGISLKNDNGRINIFSQDAWVFKAPFKEFECGAVMGTFFSDSIMNSYLRYKNINVCNPCWDIITIHIDRNRSSLSSNISQEDIDRLWRKHMDECDKRWRCLYGISACRLLDGNNGRFLSHNEWIIS